MKRPPCSVVTIMFRQTNRYVDRFRLSLAHLTDFNRIYPKTAYSCQLIEVSGDFNTCVGLSRSIRIHDSGLCVSSYNTVD